MGCDVRDLSMLLMISFQSWKNCNVIEAPFYRMEKKYQAGSEGLWQGEDSEPDTLRDGGNCLPVEPLTESIIGAERQVDETRTVVE